MDSQYTNFGIDIIKSYFLDDNIIPKKTIPLIPKKYNVFDNYFNQLNYDEITFKDGNNTKDKKKDLKYNLKAKMTDTFIKTLIGENKDIKEKILFTVSTELNNMLKEKYKDTYVVFKGGNLFYNYYKYIQNIESLDTIKDLVKISDYDFQVFTNYDNDSNEYEQLCIDINEFLLSKKDEYNKFFNEKFNEYIEDADKRNKFLTVIHKNFYGTGGFVNFNGVEVRTNKLYIYDNEISFNNTGATMKKIDNSLMNIGRKSFVIKNGDNPKMKSVKSDSSSYVYGSLNYGIETGNGGNKPKIKFTLARLKLNVIGDFTISSGLFSNNQIIQVPSEIIDISITNNTDDYNKDLYKNGFDKYITTKTYNNNKITIFNNNYLLIDLYKMLFIELEETESLLINKKGEKRFKRTILSTMIEYIKDDKKISDLKNDIEATKNNTPSKVPIINNKTFVYYFEGISNDYNKYLLSLLYKEYNLKNNNKNIDTVNNIIDKMLKDTDIKYKQTNELNYGGYYSKYLKYKHKYLELKK